MPHNLQIALSGRNVQRLRRIRGRSLQHLREEGKNAARNMIHYNTCKKFSGFFYYYLKNLDCVHYVPYLNTFPHDDNIFPYPFKCKGELQELREYFCHQ